MLNLSRETPNLSPSFLDTVARTALAAVGHPEDGVLFVAGSVVDGLANRNSDLDVYFLGGDAAPVVGSDTTVRKGEKSGTVAVLDGREISLSVLEPSGIEELARSFRECLTALSADSGIVQLESQNDLKVLHRLRTGVPLRGGERLEQLRRSTGTDRLAEYHVNVQAVAAVNRLTDVEGELAEGNDASASWMFREAVAHVARLVLALDGETNPAPKWLVRLLERGGPEPRLRSRLAQLLTEHEEDLPAALAEIRERLRTVVDHAPGAVVGPYLRRVVDRKLG
ncbi:hypothetical protein ABZO31_26680 [Streptomyces sp. HUAS MG47]|uniref:hypothetical protein n=1 Tax=Streptomyces solicamelliae TaxID=3231716 RepID=UPI0038779516